MNPTDFRDRFDLLRREAAKVLLGQNDLVHHTLVALLAGGHVLLEGVPGLGKTLLVRALGARPRVRRSSASSSPPT